MSNAVGFQFEKTSDLTGDLWKDTKEFSGVNTKQVHVYMGDFSAMVEQ